MANTLGSRKSEVRRPFTITGADHFAGFKQSFLKNRKIPQPDLKDPMQFIGWKKFCGWLRFHDPPFPEAEQVPKPRDICCSIPSTATKAR